MTAHLYLIRGLPGSGKSTFARAMIARGMADEHFEADMYFTNSAGEYAFDAEKLGEAHRWCLTCTKTAIIGNGKRVVVANTFSRVRELAPYLPIKVPRTILTMEGDFQSLHAPQDVVDRMRSRWEPF